MVPIFNKVHNKFKFNSISYNHDHLKEVAYSLVKEGEPYEREIGNFLLYWLDNKDHIIVTTSGSTGRPKKIKLKKQSMVNSAIATGDFFGLSSGDRALLCLPMRFIAGKMMLVRAIILGLDLHAISPLINVVIDKNKYYDFCAMLPMQLKNCLNNLNNFKIIIVGGAPVSLALKNSVQRLSTQIYETYGMTETMTHIAVKSLNNSSHNVRKTKSLFKTLPQVTITQNEDDCLQIEASHLFNGTLITNDIVKIHSKTEFEWLGRFDNVINSGGLKLYPEQIERKMSKYMKQRFFVSSEPDNTTNDKVILVIEGISNKLDVKAFIDLSKHEIPKRIYAIPNFYETSSGKIQRGKTLKLLK